MQILMLQSNIQETQIQIIKKCEQIYKFVDYIHDRRRDDIPIKFQSQQPPEAILDALFFKIKADYLRYIYECLSGENGILNGDDEKQTFIDFFQKRILNEVKINKDEEFVLHS